MKQYQATPCEQHFLKDVYKNKFSIFFKAILNFMNFDINRLTA